LCYPRDGPNVSDRLFRSAYPKGRNFLVTPMAGRAYAKRFGKLQVSVCGIGGLEL
jgi:hypothetical protein